MTLSPPILIILITCFLSSLNLLADELYVLKNVKVHTKASLESPVTKLLLGGETVNVLGIDGDFTEVEDTDEKVGWVASDFLTDIEPAKSVPNKEVEKIAEKKPININKKVPQPQNKLTKKETGKEYTSKTSDKRHSIKKINKASGNKNQEYLSLQKENQHLQEQLEKIHSILNDSPSTSNKEYDDNSEGMRINNFDFNFDSLNLSLWLTLGGLITGFIMGLLWSDYRQRRHHGGFKV